MSARLLSVYHRLPAGLRSLLASVHGSRLRSWRYGPETEHWVEQALARERWSPAEWAAWQQERLKVLLHRAATRVPFYREYWARRRREGDTTLWESLAHWPILDKEPLRENPQRFLADDCDSKRMFHENTSGTTGKAIDLWFSRDTVRAHYALVEARWRRWYGVSREDRWAIIGGKLVVAPTQRRPPFWVWNRSMNQLYMSSYHLAPDLLPDYWKALQRYRIKYLWGYSSALFNLAEGALQLGLSGVKLHVVITNSEPILKHQKETIARAFHCPVRETYGMCELAAAAGECEAGHLHLWPETGIIEIVDRGQPVPPGEPGELIGTGLINPDMPLIRYRVGDRAVLSASSDPCPCGRTLPRLEKIEGRTCDVLITPDNRRVGRLDSVFLPRLPVREAQIEQIALARFCVRIVPAADFNEQTAQTIRERMKERLGNVEVEVQLVPAIARSAGGKFRALICNLPAEFQKQWNTNSYIAKPTERWNELYPPTALPAAQTGP